MSDIEIMRDMRKRAGIAFAEHVAKGGSGEMPDGTITLQVDDGYPCFFAAIDFTPDGKLSRISAWE